MFPLISQFFVFEYSYKTNKPLDELGGQTIRTGYGLTLRPVRIFESFSRNDQNIIDIILNNLFEVFFYDVNI